MPPWSLRDVGSANRDGQLQPPMVLDASEHYPRLSLKGDQEELTLYAVLAIFGVLCFSGLIAAAALLAMILLPLLVQLVHDMPMIPVILKATFSLSAYLSYILGPILVVLLAFLAIRGFYVLRNVRSASATLATAVQTGKKDSAPDLSKLPGVFYLYILGSGGHTGEMLNLVKLSFKPSQNAHRRYLISRGDNNSIRAKRALENLIQEKSSGGTAGTQDAFMVARARDVGDPVYLLPKTALKSAIDVIVSLAKIPATRADQSIARHFKYPHVIVTNGPGTGFIVGLVAFLLKVLWLAPQNRLKVVYIESWARMNKLGLTGRLYYWLPFAHLFVVQNDQLAQVVGKPNIGNISAQYAQAADLATAASKKSRVATTIAFEE